MLLPEIQTETEAVARAAQVSIDAWDARDARLRVRGVCIDSDHSLDRDDAIWFEELPDGRLQVDVTIADVASFISKGSPLDARARAMAETEYGANTVIEPMFPFLLSQDDGVEGNGVFSLSDKSVRAGVTSRMIINPKTRAVESVEIFPSLILPEIANYKKVAEDIEQNPQGRFAQWAKHTALLKEIRRKGNEGLLPVSLRDEASELITHITEEGHIEELSQRESAASKMVEETALLANRANAQLFAAAGLPYLYRVHQVKLAAENGNNAAENLPGFDSLLEAEDARQAMQMQQPDHPLKLVLDRASYSARRQPHAALGEFAYSHCTSPIRRYADIPNQRMQHWLAELQAEISHHITEALPELPLDKVTQSLCRLRANAASPREPVGSGAKLLGWVGRLRMGEREASRKFCRDKVQKYLAELLRELSPTLPLEDAFSHAQQLTEKLDGAIKPSPYNIAEMEEIARDINLTLGGKRLSERDRLAQKLLLTEAERVLELAELQVLTALDMDNHQERCATIAEFSAEKRLPLTLHLAAQHHREYRVPAAELLRRMNENRLREPADIATLLVQMKTPKLADAAGDPSFADAASQAWLKQNIDDWKQLKEAVLARFSANPSFTKGFIKYLEDRYGWQIHATHASLIAGGAIAATMSLCPKSASDGPQHAAQQTLYPPQFSIGHWGKTTRHHARLQLLKALADDALQPADKVKLPRALRLTTAAGFNELASADSNTLQWVQEHTEKAGITVKSKWDKAAQRFVLSAKSAENGKEPIEFIGEAARRGDAMILAWQALLRSKLMQPVHEIMFRKREQLQAIPIDADEAVSWLGEHSPIVDQNLKLSSTSQFTQRREPIWKARLTLTLNGKVTRNFEGESTQAEVATTFANEAAIRYLRERAELGDQSIAQALENYQAMVLKDYKPGSHISTRVPYAAEIRNLRDICPVGQPLIERMGTSPPPPF